MLPLMQRVKSGEVLLADGAMGTMLFAYGLKSGECPERLSLERPWLLEEIARRYVEAGADIVETNTFGGSLLKLEPYSLDGQTEAVNRLAVEAARRAAGNKAYVAVSCGPCGLLLEPYGDAPADIVRSSFRKQLRAAIDAGAKLVCVETMTDLTEAILALEAARIEAPDIPVSVTMTFDDTPGGFRTIMGVSIEQAARELAAAGADVVGSNCGSGIETMVRIAAAFREVTDRPVLIQSNAGMPEMQEGSPKYPESPDLMAEGGRELLKMGVNIIGGCCGTTPAHIAALRTVIDQHNRARP